MNKHKQKIDKKRKDNPTMDYFLNPHFNEVATKEEKEAVKTNNNCLFHFEEDKHIKGFKEALIKKGISKEFIESKMNIIKI